MIYIQQPTVICQVPPLCNCQSNLCFSKEFVSPMKLNIPCAKNKWVTAKHLLCVRHPARYFINGIFNSYHSARWSIFLILLMEAKNWPILITFARLCIWSTSPLLQPISLETPVDLMEIRMYFDGKVVIPVCLVFFHWINEVCRGGSGILRVFAGERYLDFL